MTAFPILQFGTSRFLQAHADLFASEAMAADESGPILVVQTTQNPDSSKRLAAFATGKPYPVLIKGLAGGAVVDHRVEVRSIGAGVDANAQWSEVERLFCEARYVISNTGDRGFETDPTDTDAGPLRSFPAKLAKLRFFNPFLDHRLADIHVNHQAKKQRRFGGLIELVNVNGLSVNNHD